MPEPTPPVTAVKKAVTIKRTATPQPSGAPVQPLTVDASKEGPKVGPAGDAGPVGPDYPNGPSGPAGPENEAAVVQQALQAMASKPPFIENADGSLTVPLEFPAAHSFPKLENPLTEITLQRAVWGRRRAAQRRLPANPTILDQDTCLIAELSGVPEPVLDLLDGRDMGLVQMALGKLLFSQRMTFGS